MDWTVVLAAVAALGLAAAVAPLFGARRPWDSGDSSEIDDLLAKKARALRRIKDVDHEREAGLLSEADWKESRAEFLEDAVRLNREIAARTGIDPAAAETPR